MNEPFQQAYPEFATIPRFPGYRFGRDGTVWSCHNNRHGLGTTWKGLKPASQKSGHLYVGLKVGRTFRSYRVSRLILEAFTGPPIGDRTQACHFPDRNPKNNYIENLMWGSASDNQQHRNLQGTTQRGERNHKAKLTPADVQSIRTMHPALSYAKIAAKYGVERSTIRGIIKGRTWRHLQ